MSSAAAAVFVDRGVERRVGLRVGILAPIRCDEGAAAVAGFDRTIDGIEYAARNVM